MLTSSAIIYLCIFLCYCGFVKTDTEADGYSGEVKALFKDLTAAYKNNIANAKAKISSSAGTWDTKYAIGVINLYTQHSAFFPTLNYEMRNNYPNKTTDIWRRAGDLINRGLDVLGQTLHSVLYRGCGNISTSPVVGEDFLFNQITSTSTLKSTAEVFTICTNGNLFRISNVYGVSVSSYSQFPSEREVILKSCNVFKVEKGPIKENGYNLYHLDGQADVNGINKECTWAENNAENSAENSTENSAENSTENSAENSADRVGAGVIRNYVASMLLSLVFCL